MSCSEVFLVKVYFHFIEIKFNQALHMMAVKAEFWPGSALTCIRLI